MSHFKIHANKENIISTLIILTAFLFIGIFFFAEIILFNNGEAWIDRVSVFRLVIYTGIIALFLINFKKIKLYLLNSECISKYKIKYLVIYLLIVPLLLGYANLSNKFAHTNFSSKSLLSILALMLLLGICIVYLGNKPEKNMFVIGSTVMSVFPIITEISHPLDEWAHFAESVNIAEGHILKMTATGIMPAQMIDLFDKQSFIQFINNYQFKLDFSNISALQNEIGHAPAGYPVFLYFPTAIAVFLGKFLNLSVMDFFYFGRFANILFYILIACVIVKILPIGKNIFTAVIAMPQLVVLSSSYSVDGVGNIMIMLFIALCLHYSYSKNELRARDYILLAVSGLFLLIFKGAAYSPALFFIFLIPMKKLFKNEKLVKAAKIAIPCLILLCGALFFYKLYNLPLGLGDIRGGSVDEAKQFRFIISHPLYIISVIGNWYLKSGFPYMGGVTSDYFFGKGMILAIPLYCLYIFTAITDYNMGKEGIKQRNKEMFFYAFFAVCVLFAVPLALYMQFNPVGSGTINGIQFRYFIPIFTSVLLLLNSNKIKNSISHYSANISFCAATLLALSAAFMILQHS